MRSAFIAGHFIGSCTSVLAVVWGTASCGSSSATLPVPLAEAGGAEAGSAGGADDAGDAEVSARDAGDAAPAVLDPAQYPLPDGFAGMPFLVDAPLRKFKAAANVLDASYQYLWVVETDQGRLEADLYSDKAPKTANSFAFLTLNHFFDGLAFHRVIEDFVAQGGDPTSLGADSSKWGSGGPGYHYELEVDPALNYDAPGVLGTARSEATDSNGSQFFLMLAPAPSLNQQYSIFGKLRTGLDVLPKIVRGEPPTNPTRIVRAYVGKKKR